MSCSSCSNPKSSKSSKSSKPKKSGQSDKCASEKPDKCAPQIYKYYPDNPGASVFQGYLLCNLPAVASEGVIVLLPNGRLYQQLQGVWIQQDTGSKFFFGDLSALQVYLVNVTDCDQAKINILLFCGHWIPLAACGGSEYYSYIITDETPQCALSLPDASPEIPANHKLRALFA